MPGAPPDADREDFPHLAQPAFHPLPAVLERATGTTVFTAQKGAAHAARYAVEHAGNAKRNQCATRIGHAAKIAITDCQRAPAIAVRLQSDQRATRARIFRNRGRPGLS